MSDTPDHKLQTYVNSTGFPLQIAIKHAVNTEFKQWSEEGWKVQFSEIPWRNEGSNSSGFIDLVIQDEPNTQAVIVECKRVRDSDWIFLCPSPSSSSKHNSKPWITYVENQNVKHFGWVEASVNPSSYQSEFCIIPGSDPKSKSLLERAAADLIESIEAFSIEELSLHKASSEYFRIYYPVIVTTAEIKVCKFNRSDIEIQNGEIGKSEFVTVPYVRFSKCLTTHDTKDTTKGTTISETMKEKERTVFVVNSSKFIEFLRDLSIDRNSIKGIVKGYAAHRFLDQG